MSSLRFALWAAFLLATPARAQDLEAVLDAIGSGPLNAVINAPLPIENLGLDFHGPQQMRVDDGVELEFSYYLPDGAREASAGQVYPAIIFSNPWALTANTAQFSGIPQALAKRGYVVMELTARGFGGSGGQADFAGPRDCNDVSAAIDWLIANAHADPDAIGAIGISYGAGVATMAAVHEPRLRAVVTMSGWTDLQRDGLITDYGINARTINFLLAFGKLMGAKAAEATQLKNWAYHSPHGPGIVAWSRPRSPVYAREQIEAKQLPILFLHTYNDSYFQANHIADFYQSLHTPKRAVFYPGMHGVSFVFEQLVQAGSAAEAVGWFDHWLKHSTATPPRNALYLSVRNQHPADAPIGSRHVLVAYEPDAAQQVNYNIRAAAAGDGVLTLAPAAPVPAFSCQDAESLRWLKGAATATIFANSQDVYSLAEGVAGVPQLFAVNNLASSHVMVFTVDHTTPLFLNGMAHMELNLCSSSDHAQVSAYLFAAPSFGWPQLITQGTTEVATPPSQSAATTLALDFTLNAFALSKDQRLMLVLDSRDPSIYDASGISPDVGLQTDSPVGTLRLEVSPTPQ